SGAAVAPATRRLRRGASLYSIEGSLSHESPFAEAVGQAAPAVGRQVIGDGCAVGFRRLRVPAQLVEHQDTGGELEALLQVMSHHEDGHPLLLPELEDDVVHAL